MSEDEHPPIDDREDELDGLRIRQLAALRRGAYRARSFAIIGVVASAVAAVKLTLMTVDRIRRQGWSLWPIGFILAAAAALMLTRYFVHRVSELNNEIKTPVPLPPEPTDGADFSMLSDGSQRWKNLEKIR